MKLKINKYIFLFGIIFFMNTACTSQTSKNNIDFESATPEFTIDMLNSFSDYWSYHYRKIMLSNKFHPLGNDNTIISKDEFLGNLSTGGYFPGSYSLNNETIIKLEKLPSNTDPSIQRVIISAAIDEQVNYKLVGTKFPEKIYTDIDENNINLKTSNNIRIIKFWFIACAPCIKEMPALNKLVDEYDDYDFISFAFDSSQDLIAFMKKNDFKYKVIGDQKDFALKEMKISSFPKHLIVDQQGYIRGVYNRVEHLKIGIEDINDSQ